MNRNIEIKAIVSNYDQILYFARSLAKSEPELLVQEDIFFNSSAGRLKLRTINNIHSELIYYERKDDAQPKDSKYLRLPVPDPLLTRQMLTRAYGVRGIVRKHRKLFLVGVTRIHLDQVDGLGNFIELEVVLPADWSIEDGVRIARDLMRQLGVEDSALVSGAYVDLLTSPLSDRSAG